MSSYANRIYMIISGSDVEHIDFNSVVETSVDTLRYTLDGQQTFVKWTGLQPACVDVCAHSEGPYTYEEMAQILTGSAWVAPLE